jgi:membrane protein implicated in regulation of membrane protease activity
MSDLPLIEIIYWVSTIVGGTLFILRTVLMLLGGDLSDDALDTVMSSDAQGDTDGGFKLLSLQGLTAFFMMFGLVGLALLKSGMALVLTVFGGAMAGLGAVWLTGILFSQMKRLQSEGTLNLANAVGQQGTVYLTIPAGKSGQIQVAVQGSLRIIDAVSKDQKRIATGEKIQVVDVVDSETLVVEKTN